jgi:hypothetical protein
MPRSSVGALLIEQRGADASMAVLTGLAALNVALIALLIRHLKIRSV